MKTGQDAPRPSAIWSVVVALVFTLVMLQWSFDRFRLTGAPFLDDVNWLNEGIAMLDSVRDGGISGFVHHIAQTKTLAPYSLVAAGAFALFGIVDWAPYLMNGCLIFSLLFFFEIIRRRERLPLRTWFLAAALALAFPISGYSIVSFLGDNATGLFIAIGSIAFLQGWPSNQSALESWTGTLAWVFAFYGKATLFPETILLLVISAVAGCAIAIRELPDAPSRRTLMRRWLWRVLVIGLLILPYYSLVARALFDYLRLQNYGALRQLWAFKGTTWESALYYVTGFSGETMLGTALYLALALLLVRFVLLFSEDAAARLRFAALQAIVAIAYALPTWVENKTPTVGAPFQFLVVLTAVNCLFAILKRLERRSKIVEFLVAGAVLLTFHFPEPLDCRDTPAVMARNKVMEDLLSALREQDIKRDEPVFLTTTGYISTNTLLYEFVKRGLAAPHFFELPFTDNPSQFPAMIDQATFVLATEAGNDEVFYTAPSAFVQGETLVIVQQNPGFVEVARFHTWRGKRYFLFGRRDRVRSVQAGAADLDGAARCPVFVRGFTNAGPDGRRWSRREFEIEFPAPRGLYAELKIRFFIPQTHIDKLGPITIRASVPREGHHSETYANEGFHEFTYRYAIKQHLVATVLVRFRLNKVMPPGNGSREESGVLCASAELNPVPRL